MSFATLVSQFAPKFEHYQCENNYQSLFHRVWKPKEVNSSFELKLPFKKIN